MSASHLCETKVGTPRKPDAVKRVKVDGEVIVDKPNPEIPVSCDIVIELDTVPSLTQCAEDTRLSSKPSTRSADKITAVKPVRVSTPRDEDTVSIAKTGRKDRRLVAPMDMVTRSAGKVVEMPPLPRVRTSSYGLRQNVGPGITARLFKTPRREGVKVGLTVGKSFGMELGKSVFEKPAPTVETSVKVFEKPTKMVETLPSTHLQPLRSTIHPDPFDHPKRRGRHSTIDTTDETLPPINDVTILPKRPRGRPRKTPVVPSSPVTTHTATSFSPGMMEAPPSPPSSPPEFVEEVGKLERRKERLLSPGEEGRDACGNGKGMGREVTGMVTRSAGRIPLKRRRMVVEDDDDVDGVEIIL
ncbi:hypothetical protein BC829DRAFT_25530 [Chytridium lagenaria]|nr:hypothetical protein BC829DRAFT_25530 [Chytridium lagenaria]